MMGQHLLVALGVNLVLSFLAWKIGGVRGSGVWGGLLVGVPIYYCLGLSGFLVLVGMFVIGTVLTKFGYGKKAAMGAAEDKKGARGASHALANVGVATLAAILALITNNPVFPLAYVAALATSAMDTAGSELGPLYGKKTISLKNLRPVPPGTEGAVSLEGTLGGLLVAALLGLLGAGLGVISWPGVLFVVVGAFIGNLYEGILGSRKLLPHSWLNATNTLVGALAASLFLL